MDYEIENGIPAPTRRPGPSPKYPLRDMKVGDSFVIERDPFKSNTAIYSSIKYVSRQTGFKFATRMIAPGKRRVWRVS